MTLWADLGGAGVHVQRGRARASGADKPAGFAQSADETCGPQVEQGSGGRGVSLALVLRMPGS